MLKDAKSSVGKTLEHLQREKSMESPMENMENIWSLPMESLLISPRGAWSFRRSGGRLRLHGDSDARCFKGPRPGLLDDLEILDDLLDDLINLFWIYINLILFNLDLDLEWSKSKFLSLNLILFVHLLYHLSIYLSRCTSTALRHCHYNVISYNYNVYCNI